MLINSRNELILAIKNMICEKEIKQIDFICPHFMFLHNTMQTKDFYQKQNIEKNKMLGLEIIQILEECINKNINVNIHTFNELYEDINLENLQGKKENYLLHLGDAIKAEKPKSNSHFNIYSYIHADNLFIQFIKELKNLANNKNISTLKDLFEHLNFDKIKKIFVEYKEKVISVIDTIQESDFLNEMIKSDLKQNLNTFFDDLLDYIEKLVQDRENEKIKIIISCIAGVAISIGFAMASFGFATPVLVGLGVELFFTALVALDKGIELNQRNYTKLLTPLAQFLATRCAMLISYLNTRLFACALIINKKEIIDLSSFNLYLGSNESMVSSNLAFIMSKEDEEIDLENFFSENPTQSESLQLSNTNFISKLYLSKKDCILQALQDSITHFNHLAYIESPRFNSSKLAEFFIQKNENLKNKTEQNSTQMGKNYLIISNIPSKYNAGLTQALTQKIIGNEIQDNYRKQKKFDYDLKNNTYNSTRDYSEYRIDINANEQESYILQLSPFVKISKQKYDESKELYKKLHPSYKLLKCLESMRESSIEQDIEKQNEEIEIILNNKKTHYYPYISQFFKQNEEKKDIVEKEKKLTKEYLKILSEEYSKISGFVTSKILYFLKTPTSKEIYTLIDCLTIVFTLYQAKKLFPKIDIELKEKNRTYYISYADEDYFVFYAHRIEESSLRTESFIPEILKELQQNNQNEESNLDFLKDLEDELNLLNQQIEEEMLKPNEEELVNQILGIKTEFDSKEIFANTKAEQSFEQQLASIYGEEYLKKAQEQKIEKILSYSLCKMLAAACPLIDFTFEDNFIKITEHIVNFILKTQESGLKQALLNELGIFYLLKNSQDIPKTSKSISLEFLQYSALKELRNSKFELIHLEIKRAFITDMKALYKDKSLKDLKEIIKTHLSQKQALKEFDEILIEQIYFKRTKIEQNYLSSMILSQTQIYTKKKSDFTKIKENIKDTFKKAGLSLAVDFVLEQIFPSNYQALKEQYESIIYRLYTPKYDSPLAVIKDDFVTYPFIINSKFISFDLKKIFCGIDLCTGVFNTHLSFHYELEPKSTQSHEFLLRRLLSYLILDEKRSAIAKDKIREGEDMIDDYAFYAKDLNSLELTNCTIYQLPHTLPLFKEFRDREKLNGFEKDEESPIHAYNDSLQIIEDYAKGIYVNSKNKKDEWVEDRNKARRLLKNLNIIGQNNLKAMYVGVKDNTENSNKKDTNRNDKYDKNSTNEDKNTKKIPPKFVGRLATTIIIEDGLFIG